MLKVITLNKQQVDAALEVLGIEINNRTGHGNPDVDNLLAVFDALNNGDRVVIEWK